MQEDEEEDEEEESSGEEDDGAGLLALNGNIADLEKEEEDRDYDKTGDHEDDDDDVKDEEGQEDIGRREKRKLDFNPRELGCEGTEKSRLKQVTKVPKVHE